MTLQIVGSVALDSVKTPHGEVKRALGGSATYAGIAASYFSKPRIVGVVGEDFPKEYIDLMKKKKFDLSGLKVVPDGKTFHWAGSYDGNMAHANTLSTCLNVFEFFQPDLPLHFKNSDFVFLANIDPILQLHVLEQIQNPKMILCDTMNFWITSKKDALLEVFKRSHVILVNEGEARLLTNEDSLIHAGDKLLELGPKCVIIKKGEHGAMISSRDDNFSLPAYPLRSLKDPTVAGDTFAGGFIGYLSSQKRVSPLEIRRAMVAGTVLASFNCEEFSVKGTTSLTSRKINKRCAEFYDYAKIPKLGV